MPSAQPSRLYAEIPDGARPAFNIDDGRESELNEKLDGQAKEDASSQSTGVDTSDIHSTGVDTSDIHSTGGDERAAIINFYGRDLATHHIMNWIGDAGRIDSLSWSIMPPEIHAAYGKPVPVSPYFRHWLQQAPGMEEEKITSHGLTRDIAEIHSAVADKYIKNGKYIVKLIWWICDINKSIWIDGCAEVELLHKTKTQAQFRTYVLFIAQQSEEDYYESKVCEKNLLSGPGSGGSRLCPGRLRRRNRYSFRFR